MWSFRFAVICLIGVVMFFAGVTMPDHTIQEAVLLWPGAVMYFGGLLCGMMAMVMRK